MYAAVVRFVCIDSAESKVERSTVRTKLVFHEDDDKVRAANNFYCVIDLWVAITSAHGSPWVVAVVYPPVTRC